MSYYADDPALDAPVMAELVEPPQPPLSIGHLLLWILGSAVVLGSYRWLAEPAGNGVWQWMALIEQLMRSLTMGAGAAAILIFVRRLMTRDAPLPRQPGHWLLVVLGLYWPAYWLLLCSLYGLRGADAVEPGWESFRRYAVGSALYYVWGAALYLGVLLRLREAPRWRMFFAISAVLPLLHALVWCCMPGQPRLWIPERSFVLVRIAVSLAFVVVCVLRDQSAAVRRDWMHAAGVGLYLLGSVWYLVVYLLHMFLPREP